MAGSTNDRGGVIAGINVTPLVDVTLVLLIIFIVTAKILVQPAVPLDLPTVSKSEDVQVVFSVIIPASGAVTINGVAVEDDHALAARTRQALIDDPDLRAVIQADGSVPHRQVIHVLDELRSAGISKVAFAAVPEETEAH